MYVDLFGSSEPDRVLLTLQPVCTSHHLCMNMSLVGIASCICLPLGSSILAVVWIISITFEITDKRIKQADPNNAAVVKVLFGSLSSPE